jgi:hypothetical protein
MRKESINKLAALLFVLFLFLQQAVFCDSVAVPETTTINKNSSHRLTDKEIEQQLIDDDIKTYRPQVLELIEKAKIYMADETLYPTGEEDNTLIDLGKARDARAIPVLIDVLKNYHTKKADSAVARGDAAQALGRIGDKSAIPALKEAINDDSVRVQRESSLALLSFGEPDYARQFIRKQFKLGEYELFVMDELYKKTKNASDLDIGVLTEASAKGDEYTRLNAAGLLVSCGKKDKAYSIYMDIFKHGKRCRSESLCGMIQIGGEKAIPVIDKIMNNNDISYIDYGTLNSLEKIGKDGNKVAVHTLQVIAVKGDTSGIRTRATEKLKNIAEK